jgi:membrane-bound lytic murein transglycosylase D
MIERVLREEGVPVEIFHLAQAESGFKPKARSYASAVGMWQFMSFRGRQYGLRQNNYLDERHDPEQATRAAARHLLDLYVEFGDWYLAMAAYNSGPLRVRRAIERGGSRDFWTLSNKSLLPRQTRNYVPIILAMAYIGKNQHLYLDEEKELDPAPPMRYDTVVTDSEIHLSLIADITDSTVESLSEMNPALFRSATPPGHYALRIPEGTADVFGKEIGLIPEDKRMAWRRHPVPAAYEDQAPRRAEAASRFPLPTRPHFSLI